MAGRGIAFGFELARSNDRHAPVKQTAYAQPPAIGGAITGKEGLLRLMACGTGSTKPMFREIAQRCFEDRLAYRFIPIVIRGLSHHRAVVKQASEHSAPELTRGIARELHGATFFSVLLLQRL